MSSIKNVCVFASSCDYLDKSYYSAAAELGELLAKNNMNMVYGGSSLGMMWACASKVKENGGKIFGVMPERLYNMGVSTDECVELTVTPCMRTRKAKMDEMSDAVVALAGGFGTLEELSEMIVQKQLGYNSKAIVILNTNGFYDNLLNFFDDICKKNFAKVDARGLYYVADTPQEAIEYLKNYKCEFRALTREDLYTR